jgi:ribonucleoside-diphosphate reductase subunit M1
MYVRKRNGQLEEVSFDKILVRLQRLCDGLDPKHVNPAQLAQVVIAGLCDGITTSELDVLAAESAASKVFRHSDFGVLAARIIVSNLHRETSKSFSETALLLHKCVDKMGRPAPLLTDKVMEIIAQNAAQLDSWIVHTRDYELSYFGYKTLERAYLLRVNGKIVERPQYLYMRVAICIHSDDLPKVRETYNLLSQGYFTHATPTMTNACTPRGQLSSCYLLNMRDDSIEGIYDTVKQTALISKGGGGIGLSISNIRASGSYIGGTNGYSNGLVPMIQVLNSTARYVDQGGNKRPGAFAIYLEPHHADIFQFLELKKNTGAPELRARDLFYALWVPDLFMRRVEAGENWTLMCPHNCPGLDEVWGEEFDKLYLRYESEGRGSKTVPALKVWMAILEAQQESGTPYMMYKDACNRCSNQQNLGTIKCSNLCTEIVEYTSKDEISNCTLASVCLNMCVRNSYTSEASFDFERLHEVVKVVTTNLNRVIDKTTYPMIEAQRSNLRHRPIGIGVQGLADVCMMMRIPYVSDKSKLLNKYIFETIYHAALERSMELAQVEGAYSSFATSPAAEGILQFDLWNVDPGTDRYDWPQLKKEIKKHGLRNSLLVAPMPTASTAQILGNNEGTEPFTSNMYTRRVNAGDFQVINKHLIKELTLLKMWNDTLYKQILANNGSIQTIESIPVWLREVYRTVWEMKQRPLVDMAADRGAFICQSQSFNVFMDPVDNGKLSAMHFYGWRKGLKTGMYYLRTRAATEAIKFTVDNSAKRKKEKQGEEEKHVAEMLQCSRENKEACTACSA